MKLRRAPGNAECRRLGVILDDEQGITAILTCGLGYLLFVDSAGVTSLAEAFAAGHQCAAEFHIPDLEVSSESN